MCKSDPCDKKRCTAADASSPALGMLEGLAELGTFASACCRCRDSASSLSRAVLATCCV